MDEDLSRTRGLAWRDVGLCRDKDPNLFYPLGKGRGTAQQAEVAKAFCLVCPSREPCLAFALATDQRLGVWGGTTPEERRQLLGRRRRARVASQMLAFAVSRALATAVVTLHGDVDQPSVDGLTFILRGLIDDQRNQTVVVDLRDVSGVDPSAMTLFQDAIGWARHRGARFYLHAPSPATADRLTAERSIRDIILV